MRKSWLSATDAIRELAVARGLTYAQLSAETGIPRTSLHRFLGYNQGVHSDSLDKLLRHFGLVVVEAPRSARRPATKGGARSKKGRAKKGG